MMMMDGFVCLTPLRITFQLYPADPIHAWWIDEVPRETILKVTDKL